MSAVAVPPVAGQDPNPRAFAESGASVPAQPPLPPLYLFQDGPLDAEALRQRLNSPDFVILRGSEYDRLKQAAVRPAESSVPSSVVESVVVSGALGTDRARLRCELVTSVRSSGTFWAPIGLDGLVLRRVSEGDRDLAARATASGAWEVQVDRPGRHEITVELLAPVQSDVSGERLSLAIPQAGATRIDLTVAGPVEEAEVVPGLALSPEAFAESGETRLRASIPARSRLELRWRTRSAAEGTSPAMLSARGEIAADVDRGTLRLQSTWSIACDRGSTSELTLRVPDPQDELLELQVDDQPIAIEGRFDLKSRLVSVPLASPFRAGESRRVRLLTRRSLPSTATTRVEVEGFPIVGATSQSGVLGVTQAADLWVSGVAGRGLRQIDPRELPDSLRARPSTVLAYGFIEQPFRLALRVDPSPPTVQVSEALTLSMLPGEARIDARLDYRQTRGKVQEVRIELPAGFTLDEVGPPEVVEASQVLEESNGERTLLARLAAQAPGTTRFRIHLAGRQALSGAEPTTTVGLPRPEDASSLGTQVALVVSRELSAVLPDERSGFRLLSTEGPADWSWPGGRSPSEPVSWLSHAGSPSSLPLSITHRDRAVRGQITVQATVDRRWLDVRQTLSIQVRNGVVTTLELAVPALLEGRWEVEGGEIAARDRLDDGRGSLVRYRLTMGRVISDALLLRLRSRVPVEGLSPDRALRLEVPWIGLPGVELEPVRVEVGSDAGVRLSALGAGWSSVPDAERSAPRDGGSAAQLVWQGSATSPVFPAVEATAPEPVSLPGTVASRLWLRSVALGDGSQRVSAWYRIETHRGSLILRLPEGASELLVRGVNGPMEVNEDKNENTIEIVISDPPGAATTVNARYSRPEAGDWDGPELIGGVVQQTRREVRLPWSRALVGVPLGWIDENEWYWNQYVWKRRPLRDGAALGEWIGLPPRLVDPREDVVAGYHGYLFGRDGGPSAFVPRVFSRAALVGVCSGVVLVVGIVFLLYRRSGRLLRALVLGAALAMVAAFDATSLLQLLQSGAVGVLLLLVAALTQRLVERRQGMLARPSPSVSGVSGVTGAVVLAGGGAASTSSGASIEGSTVIRPRTTSTTVDFAPAAERLSGEETP